MQISRIKEGMKEQREYTVTDEVYAKFLDTFSDDNQIHISNEYAQSKGFKERLMHGAILSGFLSHFVGTQFPAGDTILQSMAVEYKKPVYLNDTVKVSAVVDQISEAAGAIILKVDIDNVTQGQLCARAKVQMGTLKDKKR